MWLRDNSNCFPGLVDTKLIHAMDFQLHKAYCQFQAKYGDLTEWKKKYFYVATFILVVCQQITS